MLSTTSSTRDNLRDGKQGHRSYPYRLSGPASGQDPDNSHAVRDFGQHVERVEARPSGTTQQPEKRSLWSLRGLEATPGSTPNSSVGQQDQLKLPKFDRMIKANRSLLVEFLSYVSIHNFIDSLEATRPLCRIPLKRQALLESGFTVAQIYQAESAWFALLS